MPAQPLEMGVGSEDLTLVHLSQDGLDEVSILDRPPIGAGPVIPSPVVAPLRHTVDRIRAVGEDPYLLVPWRNVQCPDDRGQFGAIVGLA